MGFNKGKKVGFIIASVLIIASLLTGVIMLLWNWLMPELFGLAEITFWQALGVLLLSKLLFGGWMHKKRCNGCHSQSTTNWKQMNPDDKQSMKEKFMQKWAQCQFEEPESAEKGVDSNRND